MQALRLSSLLLLAVVLAGCATTASVPTAQQQTQAQHARQLLDAGQYAKAAHAYADLASRYRSSDDYFRLRAAEAWRQADALPRAAALLDQIDRGRLQATDARRYDLLEAEIALARGDHARALQLADAPLADLPAPLQRRTLQLRADALAAAGEPWEAARARAKLGPLLGAEPRRDNGERILALLTGMGADALRQHAQTLTPADPMRRWLARALNRLGVQVARMAPALTQPVGTVLPGGSTAEGYEMPEKVALLLPMTGPPPLVLAARAVRQGFFAAYFQAGQGHRALPPVKVYDTSGTTAGTLAAFRQAVADGASQVVGPLTRDNVGAIFGQATLPVEVLALNRSRDDALPPPQAAEFALRPEAEGRQVARHMHRRGLARALVMTSSDSSAQRAARAFRAQFEGQGGQVAATVTLNPAEVNFSSAIHALGQAGGPASGIFLSMRAETARLLMPQLRLAGIRLPVFATSRIYNGEDNPVADGDLDGIEFCDAPWLFNTQSGLPPRAAMADMLDTARGGSARFFAFGMDAWSLLPYLDWLRAHPGTYLPGATGRLSVDDFGRVHRVPVWARFDHGIARPMDGNLEMGTPVLRPTPRAGTPAPATSAPAAAGSAPLPAGAASAPVGTGY